MLYRYSEKSKSPDSGIPLNSQINIKRADKIYQLLSYSSLSAKISNIKAYLINAMMPPKVILVRQAQ